MTQHFIIDFAVPEDVALLADLLGVLFAQEAEFTADAGRQARGLASILAQPALGRVCVVRREGRPVGMVVLLFSVSTALGGPVATLEDLVVHPDFRGAGIGTQLLRAAVDVARAHGCLRITLLTDKDNRRAQALYARQGFTASSMMPMRLHLPLAVPE